MDVFSPAERSEIMRRVRSKGTKPELVVRQLVTGMGLRYRLNSKKLPGHPDLVFGRLGLSPETVCHSERSEESRTET